MDTKKLGDILSPHYNSDLPYHNFSHAEFVERVVQILWWKFETSVWAYAHDVWNIWGIDIGHETRAQEITQILLKNYFFPTKFIDEVCSVISATELKQRPNLVLHDHRLLADADLAHLGMDYDTFLEVSSRLLLENMGKNEEIIDDDIIKFHKEEQTNFFQFLTDITKDKKNPFLTVEAAKKLPHFAQNQSMLSRDIDTDPERIIKVFRDLQESPQFKRYRI